MLNSAISKKQHENNAWYDIKWYSIKIVEHNIVLHLHNATLDSVTKNIKKCNINW